MKGIANQLFSYLLFGWVISIPKERIHPIIYPVFPRPSLRATTGRAAIQKIYGFRLVF